MPRALVAGFALMVSLVVPGCSNHEPVRESSSATSVRPRAGSSGGSTISGAGSAGSAGSGGASATRPAAITNEMVATFEMFVVAFEKLVADLATAKTDCARAIAFTKQHVSELTRLEPERTKLKAQLATLRTTDAAAGEWFGTTYGERMKASIVKLGPLFESCEGSGELKAAMGEAMSLFPMMRKKSP